ncbi:MAG: type III-B CRISPR module RAMP protein Cmr4 [Acinetobacter sp.]
MFTANKALFLYAISPVHLGAGQAIGLIDNPIQREVHTGHPIFAGSGVKGAVRHQFYSHRVDERDELNRYFGADSKSNSDYAGAVSFSDAQLVLFPVRANKSGYVYATSPLALARVKRLLDQVGLATWQDIKAPETNHAIVTSTEILTDNKLFVEGYELNAKSSDELKKIAETLSNYALADNQSFFKGKIKTDLVLMSDDDFGYFVKNATSVEPHVRINPETGVAEGGGLFYTENLPPESVMIQMVMASNERSKQGSTLADGVLNWVLNGDKGLNGRLLQVGGDATTGRGQVLVHVAGE